MANVHGLRDLNNNNRPAVGGGPGYAPLNPPDDIPFMNAAQADCPPLQQTIPYTVKLFCFPNLRILSSTVVIFVTIWALYITCCIMGIDTSQGVLTIDPNVMIRFGASEGVLIKQGQVYRLITASLLHWNLMHITMNSISLLFLLSRFEYLYPLLTIPILLVSSITGFMLSAVVNRDKISAGASVIIFGVLGGFVSYLVINWAALGRYGQVRSQLCCLIGIMLFLSLLFSFGQNIDAMGHLGGLLGGFLISLAILPGIEQKNKVITWIGIGGIIVMNLTTFLVFFLVD